MQDAKRKEKKKDKVGYHIYICRRIKEKCNAVKLMPVIQVVEGRARRKASYRCYNGGYLEQDVGKCQAVSVETSPRT